MLLDNGRTAVLADEVGREALHCIRCSACLNVCPVYERTGGHAYGSVYPGPIGAVLSPQLTGVEDNASLPYASSPLRRLLRRLPGGDRHPLDPGAPARRARRGAEAHHAGGRGVPGAVEGHVATRGSGGWRSGPPGSAGSSPAAGRRCPAPCRRRRRRGPAAATCPPRRRRRSPSSGPRSTADERPRGGPRPDPHGARRATAAVPPVVRDYRTADDRPPAPGAARPAGRPARGLPGDRRSAAAPAEVAATVAGPPLAPVRRATSSSPRACPAGWRPDGAVEDDGRPAVGPRRLRRHRHRRRRRRSPRPAPWSSTAPRCPGGGRCRCCPTAWSAWSRPPRSSAACPRASPSSTRSRR